MLHDIGKIEISGEILRKAAALSSEERELMEEHTVKGAYLLSAVGSVLEDVVPIVISHHKYFMSSPESQGDETNKIPLGARVVAVVDAFDAMTTDRPYRKGMPPWDALEEVVKNTGKQFDPEVVEAFKRVMRDHSVFVIPRHRFLFRFRKRVFKFCQCVVVSSPRWALAVVVEILPTMVKIFTAYRKTFRTF